MASFPDHKGGNQKKRSDQTVLVSDKTVLLDRLNLPLIFGWLIDDEKGEVYRIAAEVFTIGSDPSSDLTLRGRDIQTNHCSIYYVDGHFELNDNNTKGATQINGQAVKREKMNDRDTIQLGRSTFQFRCFKGPING